AADLVLHELALAGMEAGPYVQAELIEALADRTRARNRPGRAVEGGEEAIAGRVHLIAAKAAELDANSLVVVLQQLAPRAVAELGRPGRRADDVGEKHGGEHAVRLGSEPWALAHAN